MSLFIAANALGRVIWVFLGSCASVGAVLPAAGLVRTRDGASGDVCEVRHGPF
jgi:hypothetical protein